MQSTERGLKLLARKFISGRDYGLVRELNLGSIVQLGSQTMVILEQTKTQLKFRYRPDSIWMATGGWIVGTFLLIAMIYLQLSWIFYLWWIPLFLVLNIVASIALLIFAGRVVICHFDKDYNGFTLKRGGWLNTQVIWHPLAHIIDVQVEAIGWNPDRKANCQIALFLKSGDRISLDLGLASINDKLNAVNLIRKFLDMPPQKWS
ncbi:hypothetical protein [Microseira wollei]|uniref:DUF304 domain-containing protein n=1 Tax=Microseira wollei NIES-4236 TaxID=2530354 RepID=A0AAV3XMK2_9CYAN|nr:hypothetical protein [Microseira wollei]GET41395.1 hypothetical protein MiSe_62070 [Microseira wollei NIES-4236]